MNVVAYCDGFCSANGTAHSEGGGSYAVYELEDGEIPNSWRNPEFHSELKNRSTRLCNRRFAMPRNRITNNEAEALTLQMLIGALKGSGLLYKVNSVHICMDSELVINHMKGYFRVNKPALLRIYKEIHEAVGDAIKKIIFHHIPGTVMKQCTVLKH